MTNKETIRIGRGHESDVRISDISVSRCHSVIRLTSDAFILEDNNSKFGTLLQVRRSMCLDYKSNFSIQLGRSLIVFNLKSKFNLCSCMSKNSDKNSAIRLNKLSLPPSYTDSSICMLVENRLL
jgi:pSer/pThr/pTyr-binding forkhead associated (FHA) protein